MDETQYDYAEEDLLTRMQLMMEKDSGHVEPMNLTPTDHDSLDDPIVHSLSNERERAKDEFRVYCKVVKPRRHVPKSFVGSTLRLGCIQMGKVATRGDDIKASFPFVHCNLADFIDNDGRFDLVSFLGLQKAVFPTLYKLSVCLASIRSNEVGCERFFSTAGWVSCPRRTSLKVRNYECLATLKANIRNVFIDEKWVVNQYLMMEQKKSWADLDKEGEDLRVLNLERELLAESLGVGVESLPGVDEGEPISTTDVIEIDDELST
jgi:hypothetical protein